MKTRTVQYKKGEAGFTIIEVMVAMTVFIVIITVGLGAVLDSVHQHYRSQDIRTVMDNLNFIMEDMSRNIRLGSNFRCVQTYPDLSPYDSGGEIIPLDCAFGTSSSAHNVLMFKDMTGHDVLYLISTTDNSISKASYPEYFLSLITPQYYDTNTNTVKTSIQIDPLLSGFDVSGASPDDGRQPLITIRLSGTITTGGTTSRFSTQTTVTPRLLDS